MNQISSRTCQCKPNHRFENMYVYVCHEYVNDAPPMPTPGRVQDDLLVQGTYILKGGLELILFVALELENMPLNE